jgi:hypothetical protein
MPSSPSSTVSTEDLLAGFLRREPDARQELPIRLEIHLQRRALHYLRKRNIAYTIGLAPEDLKEDVFQRVWELLLRKNPSSFDPSRGSAEVYLEYLVRTAVMDVAAEHSPPGQRTRPQKDAKGAFVRQPGALSLDEVRPDGTTLAETLSDDVTCSAATNGHRRARRLLTLARCTAAKQVRRALDLVYSEDASFSAAARAAGTDSQTLRRDISGWVDEQQVLIFAIA